MVKKYFALSLVTASMMLAACSSSDDDADENDMNTPDVDTPVVVADPPETLNDGNSIMDTIRANAELSTLVTAIETANLNDLLDNEEKMFTLFAPNNAAFAAAFPGDALNELLADTDGLTNALTYHVVADMALDGAAVVALDGTGLTTAQSGDIAITLNGDGTPRLNDSAGVVASDQAGTSIVHTIDMVLNAPAAVEPPVTTDPDTDPDTTDPDVTDPGTSSSAAQTAVVARGDSANFSDGFNSNIGWGAVDTNAWTIFVPTDGDFDGSAAAADYQNYVVVNDGALSLTELAAAGTVVTNGGKEYAVTGDGTGTVMVNGSTISLIDDSGMSVIYSIDGLLD